MADHDYKCYQDHKPILLGETGLSLFIFFCAVLSLVSIVSNSTILFVIIREERLRTISNFFMCSMALSDLLSGLIGIPASTAFVVLWSKDLLDRYRFMSYISHIFIDFAPTASCLNVAAMSIDRYIAVKYPLKYPFIMTRLKCAMIIGSLWLINISFDIFFVMNWLNRPSSGAMHITKGIWIMLIPLVITIYCNVQIYRITRKHIRQVSSMSNQLRANEKPTRQPQRNSNSSLHFNRKTAVTFGIITIVFLITFIPNFGLTVAISQFKSVCDALSRLQKVHHVCVIVLYAGCALNPLVYGSRNTEIRAAIKKLLKNTLQGRVAQRSISINQGLTS